MLERVCEVAPAVVQGNTLIQTRCSGDSIRSSNFQMSNRKEKQMAGSKTANDYKSVSVPKSRMGRKKNVSTHIEHMDGDSHVVTHAFERKAIGSESPGMVPSTQREEKKHAFTSKEEMLDHLKNHFGIKSGSTSKNQPAESKDEEQADEQAGEDSEEA
jgi:hypothetical protein